MLDISATKYAFGVNPRDGPDGARMTIAVGLRLNKVAYY